MFSSFWSFFSRCFVRGLYRLPFLLPTCSCNFRDFFIEVAFQFEVWMRPIPFETAFYDFFFLFSFSSYNGHPWTRPNTNWIFSCILQVYLCTCIPCCCFFIPLHLLYLKLPLSPKLNRECIALVWFWLLIVHLLCCVWSMLWAFCFRYLSLLVYSILYINIYYQCSYHLKKKRIIIFQV